jgi:uncharacterized protein YuzE
MEVTYSKPADAAYIRLTRKRVTGLKGREVAPGLIVDLDASGQAVGIEVLGLRSRGLELGQVEVRLESEESSGDWHPDERRLARALEPGVDANAS